MILNAGKSLFQKSLGSPPPKFTWNGLYFPVPCLRLFESFANTCKNPSNRTPHTSGSSPVGSCKAPLPCGGQRGGGLGQLRRQKEIRTVGGGLGGCLEDSRRSFTGPFFCETRRGWAKRMENFRMTCSQTPKTRYNNDVQIKDKRTGRL